MGKKAHSKSTCQDDWFAHKKFADWIEKTNKLSEVQCLVCKKSIGASLMGVSALDYHAKGAKHPKNLKDSEGMDIRSMFNKMSQQSTAAKQETTFNQETTTKQAATGTAKQGSTHVFTLKENSLNTEILWRLCMVLGHDESMNSELQMCQMDVGIQF